MFNADAMEVADELTDLIYGIETRTLCDGLVPNEPLEVEERYAVQQLSRAA